MSIDDTPEVKWSNAWWCYWGIGVVLPVFLVVCAIYTLITGHSYTLASMNHRAWFVPVYGLQARLMSLSYPFFAIAAFGYGYARYSHTLSRYDQALILTGLFPACILITWCSILFAI